VARRWVFALVVVAAASIPAAPARAAVPYTVVQMNLCDSGLAHSCYTFGRAVDEAVTKIHRYPPDLVTFQEICREDLYGKLAGAMARTGRITVDFVPAYNRYTGQPYRCVNEQEFGIGLILRGTSEDRHEGWYAAQDGGDEVRAWLCTTARLTVCTTHLSIVPDIARRQCAGLTSILRSTWVRPEVIVAGDLNLRTGCAPDGYEDHGDGALQHVLATVPWLDGAVEPMRFTDHPMLYARYQLT
jgi:endonuclease/exonuclease/phosphatase family metal-dependent hydrolase